MNFEHETNPYAAPTTIGSISALGSSETLRRVATGLHLVYWGIGIVLITIIGGFVLGFIAAGVGPNAAMSLLLIIPAGVIAGIIVGFVGRLFCLAVPPQTGAQGLIYGAVACDVLTLATNLSQFFLEVDYLPFVSNLLSLAAAILFILFLKKVSEFVGRLDLAAKAKSLIVLGATTLVVGFAGGVLMVVAPPIVVLVGLAILVLALVMLIQYLRLLSELRLAILAHA